MTFQYQPAERLTHGLKWLLIVNIVVFLIAKVPQVNSFIYSELALHANTFKPWQCFSYMFVHFDLMHLFFNLLGLFFFGPNVEQSFGSNNFIKYYLLCGCGGAFAAYLMNLFTPIPPTIGASGAIFGIYYACYRFFPDAIVHVYFLFPIKLKYLLLLLFLFSFLALFDTGSDVAHFAHLGGLLTGVAYFRYSDSLYIWMENRRRKKIIVEEEKEIQIKDKVDQLLHKISKDGMDSLSSQEKAYLKKASKKFHKS